MTFNSSRLLAPCFLVVLALSIARSVAALEAPSSEKDFEQGLRAFQRGNFEQAVSSWTDAARSYGRERKPAEQMAALTHLSQAYSALGQYKQALKILDAVLELAQKSGDPARIASVLAGLGSVHIAVGRPETAETYLKRSLGMARELRDSALAAVVLNNLGNLFATQKKLPEAIAAYRESIVLANRAGQRSLAARALGNAAVALRQTGEPQESKGLLDTALDQLRGVSPSHETAFAFIHIGLAYRDLRPLLPDSTELLLLRASGALNEAGTAAESIGDRRTASYAWGYLGTLYEDERRYQEALQLTRQAVFAAQQVNAPESLYRWQWQTGRLLKKLARMDDAISAYRHAVHTLQSVRAELSIGYGGRQISFRESVGPLYFELADLLLQRAASLQDRGVIEPYLVEARQAVELFKIAELRDYFQDDCVDNFLSKIAKLDIVSPTAAVIYPILLPDRTELLVSLPTGMKRVTVSVRADALTQEVREFRRKLEKRTTREFLRHARQLYDWLIRPLEADLRSSRIDTLVFVPDGPLRTIPMAALHDGEQFLVENYALAITPGLNLTDPRPIDRGHTKMLAVGVTESVQGFPALPFVAAELEAIGKLFGKSTTLVDGEFRLATLEKMLKEEQYTIVHVASHGEFGGDAEKTFLVAFDDKLTMRRLDALIGVFKYRDGPLELLTLSACESAEGDDRAALGLAGVAVRAGARSAVATLWNVNDQAAADLVAEFYRQLQDSSISRATALKRAQVKILNDPRYDHPGFWSPFLLI
ncbi:MAG: CHAT domain-containing protein, partial [Thermoanaerobaculia bacterium]